MRAVKLLAVVLMFALAGVIYAAGAMQDAARTQEPTQATKSCCKKHDAASAATHAAMKHEGESCCGVGVGCCCGKGSCAVEHKGEHSAATQKTPAASEKAGCCSGETSCCSGAGCGEHHKAAETQSVARSGESCCKEGAGCCKDKGGECCKTHKPDAAQAAAITSGADTQTAGCCGDSCACCGDKDSHRTHAGGQ